MAITSSRSLTVGVTVCSGCCWLDKVDKITDAIVVDNELSDGGVDDGGVCGGEEDDDEDNGKRDELSYNSLIGNLMLIFNCDGKGKFGGVKLALKSVKLKSGIDSLKVNWAFIHA